MGPHGILWGDSSVHNAEEANHAAHAVQECFSGSANPPAILMGLEDDEEDNGVAADSLGSLGSPIENYEETPDQEDGEWLVSFSKEWKDEPKNKNRRLVSPLPVKLVVACPMRRICPFLSRR